MGEGMESLMGLAHGLPSTQMGVVNPTGAIGTSERFGEFGVDPQDRCELWEETPITSPRRQVQAVTSGLGQGAVTGIPGREQFGQ